jgi:hypothetical protein
MQILSALNRPMARPRRTKIPSVWFTTRHPKSNTVKRNNPTQLHQRFPTKNIDQAFENIVSTSGRDLLVQLEYRSQPICLVHNCAQREGNEKLSIMQLSSTFGRRRIRVKAAGNKVLEPPKGRRCHVAVDENTEANVLDWINAQAAKCNRITGWSISLGASLTG